MSEEIKKDGEAGQLKIDEVNSIDSRLSAFNVELKDLQEKYKLKLIAVPQINGDGVIVANLQALDHDEINKRLKEKLEAEGLPHDAISNEDGVLSPYDGEEKK